MNLLLSWLSLLALATSFSNGYDSWDNSFDAIICQNGGIVGNDGNCQCYSYFKESDCGQINCLNQGYLPSSDPISYTADNTADRCICPTGYYGLYCESYQQAPARPDLFYVTKPDLIVFVNTEIDTLYNTFVDYQNAVFADPNFNNYANYYLFALKSDGKVTLIPTPTSSDFRIQLSDPSLVTSYSGGACNDKEILSNLFDLIRLNKFSQKTINVFTQTPSSISFNEELENLAVAFNIKFNIYFSFFDFICDVNNDNNRLSNFELLAQRTGGIYWPFYKYDGSLKMVGVFVNSTSNLQQLGYQAYAKEKCSASFPFIFNNVYGATQPYVILKSDSKNITITGDSKNCWNFETIYSYTGLISVTRFVAMNNCTATVTGACSAQAIGIPNAASYQGINIFPSFTDTPVADSSYFAMKTGIQQYIRLHIENVGDSSLGLNVQNVQLNSDCISGNPALNVIKSESSTFEFITESAASCSTEERTCKATKFWLTVNFQMEKPGIGTYNLTRIVPIKCLTIETPIISTTMAAPTAAIITQVPTTTLLETTTTTAEPTTTSGPSTTEMPRTTEGATESTTSEAATTTAQATTTTTEAPTTTTAFSCSLSPDSPPSMIIGYSNQYDKNIAKDFLGGPSKLLGTDAPKFYSNFIVFALDNPNFAYNVGKSSTNNFNSFITIIANISQAYIKIDDGPSNVADLLLELLQDSSLVPRTTVLLFVKNVIPDTEKKIQILQLATSKQIRVNFFIDIATYLAAADTNGFEFYEQVSAVSDGHFIIADPSMRQWGFSSSQNITEVIFSNSFPHRLVLSKITNDASTELGIVDLTAQSGDHTFYITSTYSPYSAQITSVFLLVTFTEINGNTTISKFNTTNLGGGNLGNLGSINVPAGKKYTVKVVGTASDGDIVYMYRLWEEWDSSEQFNVKVEYMNVDDDYQGTLDGPRYDITAVPKMTLTQLDATEIENLQVEFYDCNGEYVYTFDHYNKASVITNDSSCKTEFMVNPFVCKFNQNCSLNHDILQGFYTTKYKIMMTSGLFQEYYSNFWCAQNTNSLSEQCPFNPSVLDPGDDSPTTTTESTSTSSTTESIPSSTAATIDSTDCQCLNVTGTHNRGPRCTVPDCSNNGYLIFESNAFVCKCKERYTGDNCEIGICDRYEASRTARDVNYRTLTIAIAYSDRTEFGNIAKELANLASQNLDNIWQFNVISVCNGTLKTRYFGTSNSEFNDLLEKIANPNLYDQNLLDACGNSTTIDLTSIVSYGLQSVGKEIRGVFWIAGHNSDDVEVDSLPDFWTTVQGYKQEVFVTNVVPSTDVNDTRFEDTLQAIVVTGGERIDLETYAGSKIATYMRSIIISQTSLNFYDIKGKATISVEENAYITISNYDKTQNVNIDDTICPLSLGSTDKISKVYECPAGTRDLEVSVGSKTLITARVLNGSTPSWTIVNETNQDNLNAFPVLNTFPTLIFDFNATKEIIDEVLDVTPGSFARQAERPTCTFQYSSTFQLPVTRIGFDSFVVSITIEDKMYSKVFPYVITETLENRCINGNATSSDAKCDCNPGWSGADCSRPICNHGSINTMQNACYCDINWGGPTCNEPQDMIPL